jgi:hypothetical protein
MALSLIIFFSDDPIQSQVSIRLSRLVFVRIEFDHSSALHRTMRTKKRGTTRFEVSSDVMTPSIPIAVSRSAVTSSASRGSWDRERPAFLPSVDFGHYLAWAEWRWRAQSERQSSC